LNRRGSHRLFSAFLVGLVFAASMRADAADAPRRILSNNMCTDQLLLDLASPDQIIALSPYARDPVRSWAAEKAARYPALSGSAEEILALKPDLVVAGRYGKPETRAMLAAKAIRVESFNPADSLAEARRQILDFGALIGAENAAIARVQALDAAIDRLRASANRQGLSVLPLSRRGWVSGKRSLISDILALAGLIHALDSGRNKGPDRSNSGGFVTLEAIVALKPDAILVAREDFLPEDQGTAMLVHPAIQAYFPPERRLTMPEKLTICGGPMLVEAIDHLAQQIAGLRPRVSRPAKAPP
jgi:iron complex transport system substrate-binding protein